MMDRKNGFLVVGGDSLVGSGIFRALEARGKPTFATTRRRETTGERRVFLDFEKWCDFRVPKQVDYAFVVAAATNYERCERDPLAERINVDLIPRFVSALLEQEIFVTFISTNAVFGGQRPWPLEDDPHAPGIAYARQKAAAEKAIRLEASGSHADGRLNIVRLTKILDRSTSPLPNWLSAWKRGDAVQPFSDLIFAPISVRFVGESLAGIGERRICGNLHLSGSENVTYVDLALALARKLGVPGSQVKATTASEQGVEIAFKPRYSGLGMSRTTQLSGITPQTLGDVVTDLTN